MEMKLRLSSNLRREWSLVRSMRSVDAEGRALALSQCGLGLILVSMLYVCWICWFSTLLGEVFPIYSSFDRILRFPPRVLRLPPLRVPQVSPLTKNPNLILLCRDLVRFVVSKISRATMFGKIHWLKYITMIVRTQLIKTRTDRVPYWVSRTYSRLQ